jgi:hypothetical protein
MKVLYRTKELDEKQARRSDPHPPPWFVLFSCEFSFGELPFILAKLNINLFISICSMVAVKQKSQGCGRLCFEKCIGRALRDKDNNAQRFVVGSATYLFSAFQLCLLSFTFRLVLIL